MSSTLAWDIIARDHASKAFEHVGRSVEGMGNKVEHSSHSFGGFKKAAVIGVAAMGALTLGAGLVAEKMIDVVKAAADDQHAQVILANTARNAAGANKQQIASMEEWIVAQGRAKGVMLNDLRPAMGKLLTVTHSVTKAQHLASLAMDVSAGSGKSLDSITLALVKAQNGSLGGLSRLGVATKDAAGNTLSLKQVTAELAKTYRGDAAKSAATATGQMDRLKVAFEEGKVALGDKLLPILGKFSGWLLDKAVPAAQKFGAALSKQLGPAVRQIGKWFTGTFLPALTKVYHFWISQWVPAILKFVRSVMPSLKSAFNNVKQGIHNAQPALQLFGVVLKKVWAFTKSFLIPLLTYLAEHQLKALGIAFKVVATIIGSWAKVVMFVWNNALVPFFKFLFSSAAKVMHSWADMLRVISHVPGFGWAANLANTLDHASAAAQHTADNINKIPTYHKTTLDIHTVLTGSTTHSSAGGHSVPVPRMVAPRMASGGDIHVHVNGSGDPQSTAREIVRVLRKHKRLQGGADLGIA